MAVTTREREPTTTAGRAFVLPDDELASLFVERGDTIDCVGPVGVDLRAPYACETATDLLAWARGRSVFVWRGLFARDPTLDEPLALPRHVRPSAANVRISALALSQSVLFAVCDGARRWGAWDLAAPGRPWRDGPAIEKLGLARGLALADDKLTVLYDDGCALFDVSDPRRPQTIGSTNRGFDEPGWEVIDAVATSEWVITLQSKPLSGGGAEPAPNAATETRFTPYALGVYRRRGLEFAGSISLYPLPRPEQFRPSIDALDERLLVATGSLVRLIDLRRLDARLRDRGPSLEKPLIDPATIAAYELDAAVIDTRLCHGATAAVSVRAPPTSARLERIDARRNSWGPTGVLITKAIVVRVSFAEEPLRAE